MRQSTTRAEAITSVKWRRLRALRAAVASRGFTERFVRHVEESWQGYAFVLCGIAASSLFIAAVNYFVRFDNISLVYLLVVLWLARSFGRGPAVAASLLAFLTYDFFFVPPFFTLTISDPTEWFSLGALLATSLVLGHATAAAQERAREALANQRHAVASQERTQALYTLAQLTATTSDSWRLLDKVCAHVVETFTESGLAASAILLPDERGLPAVRAAAPADGPLVAAIDVSARGRAACAAWALEHGSVVGVPSATAGASHATSGFYVPLRTPQHVVGVLAIAGAPAIRALLARSAKGAGGASDSATAPAESAPEQRGTSDAETLQAALFDAFCTQIAQALDRLALQREAIRVEALRESDRLKDLLLGSVTHDLRTPLAAIEVAAGSLLEPDVKWTEAEREEFLESIVASADRLNRLVSNLLDLSRLEAGVALPEKRWYLFGDILGTVVHRLELAGRLGDRRVAVEMPPDLPLVQVDHAQIEQVLTNLLENAVKYSPPQSTIQVRAAIEGVPPMLEVRVHDEGIGIPKDELPLIFDRFYRVQHVRLPWAPARPPIGTGLGLAICAAIIEAHGGRIWAESERNTGSTFIFTLPMAADVPPSELPDLAESIGASDAPVPPLGARP